MVQLKLDEKVGGRNCKGTRETKISIRGHDLDGESITWWHFHTRVNSSWKWRRLVKARASISNRDVRFHETRCHINRSDKIYSWLDTRSPSNFRRRDRHHLSLVFIELIKRIGCTPNNFSSPRRIEITISKVKPVSSWRFLSNPARHSYRDPFPTILSRRDNRRIVTNFSKFRQFPSWKRFRSSFRMINETLAP